MWVNYLLAPKACRPVCFCHGQRVRWYWSFECSLPDSLTNSCPEAKIQEEQIIQTNCNMKDAVIMNWKMMKWNFWRSYKYSNICWKNIKAQHKFYRSNVDIDADLMPNMFFFFFLGGGCIWHNRTPVLSSNISCVPRPQVSLKYFIEVYELMDGAILCESCRALYRVLP